MTAEPSVSPVAEGVRSLEVRWIFPGQLETAVAEWLERFPAESQSREDTYLVQKWSFPVKAPGQDSDDLPGWRPVRKRRRICRFSLASGPVASQATGLDQQLRCAVELTEVFSSGQDWWTLGFEAAGPEDALSHVLQATAARVFAQAMPGSAEPGLDESRSYMEWLRRRPGTGRYVDA